jgi:hypothetical protein
MRFHVYWLAIPIILNFQLFPDWYIDSVILPIPKLGYVICSVDKLALKLIRKYTGARISKAAWKWTKLKESHSLTSWLTIKLQ